MRLVVRVQPGARSTSVGGSFDGTLVVRVSETAEKGRATVAALRALADALGLRARDIRLVSGAVSRWKTVEIDVGSSGDRATREEAEVSVLRRIDELRRTGEGEEKGRPGERGDGRANGHLDR